jgi:hypothetical protein
MNQSLNQALYGELKSRGYEPKILDANGKEVALPDQAQIFQFNYKQGSTQYGSVTVSVDTTGTINVVFDNSVASSPKSKRPGELSWSDLLGVINSFGARHGAEVTTNNQDRLSNDMELRPHRKEESRNQFNEGYHAAGKKASYNDSIPTVKMIIQHSKVMEEGEQRFRHVDKIFVENTNGERFLLPTKKPGLGRVYANHIKEGGTPYDDRGKHITSLIEEFDKMASFCRATKNKQFNESVQKLVEHGVAHYQSIRETLQKLSGPKGYAAYFENFTPMLAEDDTESVDLSEMFKTSSLDTRIESALPILSRICKNINETSKTDEVTDELSEWADNIIESNYFNKDAEAKYDDDYDNMVSRMAHKAKERDVDIEKLAKRLKRQDELSRVRHLAGVKRDI